MVIDPLSSFHTIDLSNNITTKKEPENTEDMSNNQNITYMKETECYNSADVLIQTAIEEETKKKLNKIFNFKTLASIKKTEDGIKENVLMNLCELAMNEVEDSSSPITSLLSNIAQKSDEVITLPILETITEKLPKSAFHEETQYLNLIREIINTGSYEKSRNGNTYTKFGYTMKYSLTNGRIPLLTTKKLAWKSCFEELFWFIRGSTSSTELQARGVNIWKGNGSREFLDSRGLYHLEEGDLGPIYGHQWRHFNAEYTNSKTCYQGEGIDQLKYIIDELSNPETRSSRRLVMTAWNPCQINQMALPPCHVMAQFHVRDNKYLSCALFQRSGDVGLGIPFNIASYSLLTHILAKHCGLEADEFVHFLGNCHIYEEHMEALKSQILLEPMIFPRINITKRDTIEEYSLDDVLWVTQYHSHPTIKMAMKA